MEDFLEDTHQSFGMIECEMDHKDCRRDWSVVGTILGKCLTYNPGNVTFPKSAELHVSLLINDSGKWN